MKDDLRFNILKHFEELNNSTAETIANDWLSKQHGDLGTIRRSIIDLVESDFIRLSSIGTDDPVKWLELNWDSESKNITQDDKDKKSSKRLVEQVGINPKVKDVKMYTTVKGLMFIKEYRRFKNYHVDKVIYAVLGFILAIIGYLLRDVIPTMIKWFQ